MKLDKLIKELEECYDKKQKAFFCTIPSNFANDILNYLKEYQKLKQTLAEIKEIAEDESYIGFWDEQISEILQKISEYEEENLYPN